MTSSSGNHADLLSEPGRRKGARSLHAFLTTVILCSGAIGAGVQISPQGLRECDECTWVVLIPAGSYLMGADRQFEDAKANEVPRHHVTIATAFAMEQYEVTSAKWTTVMGSNSSVFSGHERPVDNVS